jgi:hypothetical protein
MAAGGVRVGDEKKEETKPTKPDPFPPPIPTTGGVKPRPDSLAQIPGMAFGSMPVGGDPTAAAELWKQYADDVTGEQTNRQKDSTRDIANQPKVHKRETPFAAGENPSNEQLAQELQDKVEEVREQRATPGTPENVSKTTRSPMLAGVMDTENGDIVTAANTDQIPEKMHPIMKERLIAQRMVFDAYRKLSPDGRSAVQKMTPDEMEKFMADKNLPSTAGGMDTNEMLRLVDSRRRMSEERLKTDEEFKKLSPAEQEEALFNPMRAEIGTHGEFHALNKALLDREAKDPSKPLTPEDLGGFMLHNSYADPKKGQTEAGPMPRCHHCEALTGGVAATPALAHADHQRDRHDRKGPPA